MGSLTVGEEHVTEHPSQLQHTRSPFMGTNLRRLPACSLVWRSCSEAVLCSSSGPALDTSASSRLAGLTLLVVPWLLLISGLRTHKDVRLSSAIQKGCVPVLLSGCMKELRFVS